MPPWSCRHALTGMLSSLSVTRKLLTKHMHDPLLTPRKKSK
nr:MAG TPA: hypothetical protein [Caudoviricetes sp.]